MHAMWLAACAEARPAGKPAELLRHRALLLAVPLTEPTLAPLLPLVFALCPAQDLAPTAERRQSGSGVPCWGCR